MSNTKSAAQLESEIARALNVRGGSGYVGFERWADVLAAARQGERLWYQGALDRYPHSVRIVKVFKNGGIRVDPLSNQASDFTAGAGHVGHFFRRA